MKKLLLVMASVMTIFFSTASSISSITPKQPNASEVFIMLGNGKSISLLQLSSISRSSLEKLTGKKMNIFQRFAFRGAKERLQSGIAEDGTITDKKLLKVAEGNAGDFTSGFHIGGFALGFILGPIGVLIAYLINDDKKKSRVKWAWLGFAAWIVLLLVFSASIL